MTANEFASLLNARRIGPGRWMAKCPGHPDRTPSLSIATGRDGRVLVRCWAGCDTKAVLNAAGLAWADLFAGSPPTPAKLDALRLLQDAKERSVYVEGKKRREAFERVRCWRAVVTALGAKLARCSEDDALTRAFHTACEKQAVAEQKAEAWARRVCPKG
jgi:hypothetical protein